MALIITHNFADLACLISTSSCFSSNIRPSNDNIKRFSLVPIAMLLLLPPFSSRRMNLLIVLIKLVLILRPQHHYMVKCSLCFVWLRDLLIVSRIVRVVRQPRGNMLLIGIGGSGRQSLTRLAAFICDYDTFQIEVSKQYRRLEFREGQ